MKYRRLLAVLLVLVFSFPFIPNNSAFATNDDFEVEYEFFPEIMGFKGGDAILTLSVKNTGTTNITWVDVVINTFTTFTQRWTGTITPGMTRAFALTVPIGMDDLDEDRILQVSMNNNSSSNPDGVKMFAFKIDSTHDIFENGVSRSPTQAVYNIGDSVRITHTFKNIFETHATINTRTRISIAVNDEWISMSEFLPHGNVFPDATISHITDLHFDESYVGEVLIYSEIYYTLMDEDYDYSGSSLRFTVASPEPDIDFAASLYATPSEISPGDAVMFTVAMQNRGDEIDSFEIRDSEGGLVAETGRVGAGESRNIMLEYHFHEDSDVSFVVIGYADGYSQSHETNSVHITVTEPAAAPAATATPSPTAARIFHPHRRTQPGAFCISRN